MKRNYLQKIFIVLALAMSLIILPCIGVYATVYEYSFTNSSVTDRNDSISTTSYFSSSITGSCAPYLKIASVTQTGHYYAGNYVNNKEKIMNEYAAAANYTEGQVIRASLESSGNEIRVKGKSVNGVRMRLDYVRVDN